MPDNKLYRVTIGDKSQLWADDKFERNRDKLYENYPDAQVYEVDDAFDKEYDEPDAGSSYLVKIGNKEQVWDADKFSRNRKTLNANYPNAKVSRLTAYQRPAEQDPANYNFDDEPNPGRKETGPRTGGMTGYLNRLKNLVADSTRQAAPAEQPAEAQPAEARPAEEQPAREIKSEKETLQATAAMLRLRELSSIIGPLSPDQRAEYDALDSYIRKYGDTAGDGSIDTKAAVAKVEKDLRNVLVSRDKKMGPPTKEEKEQKEALEAVYYSTPTGRKELFDNKIREVVGSRDDYFKKANQLYSEEAQRIGDESIANRMIVTDAFSGSAADIATLDAMVATRNPDWSYYKASEYLLQQAENILDAGKRGGAANFGRGFMEGVWNGMTQFAHIGDDLTTADLGKKIGGIIDGLPEGVSDEDIDAEIQKKLTDGEKAFLEAYQTLAAVEEGTETGWLYTAGKSGGESVEFMLEFLLGSGLVGGATKGISKAGLSMFKKYMQKKIRSKAGKFLVKNAIRTGAEDLSALVGGAVQTAVGPSTYTHALQSYAQLDEHGRLSGGAGDVGESLVGSFIENTSELGLGPFNKLLGSAAKAGRKALHAMHFGTYTPQVASFFGKAGVKNFTEEWGEELNGAIVNTILGLEKDSEGNSAWDQFWNGENQLILVTSFTPTIGTGKAFSAGQRVYFKNRQKKSAEALTKELAAAGYKPNAIKNILDNIKGSTPEELANNGREFLHQVYRDNEGNESLLKAFVTHIQNTAYTNSVEAGQDRIDSERRQAMLESIEGQIGQFYTEHGADGQKVRRARRLLLSQEMTERLGKGRGDVTEAYVINEDATRLQLLFPDGSTGFVSKAEVERENERGLLHDSGDVSLEEILDAKLSERSQGEERQRMETERAEAQQQMRGQLQVGATVNLGGTEAEPQQYVYRGVDPVSGKHAFFAIVPDKSGNPVESTTPTLLAENEVAERLGIQLEPKTDAEIASDEAAVLAARDERRQKYAAVPLGEKITAVFDTGDGQQERFIYEFVGTTTDEETGDILISAREPETGKIVSLTEAQVPGLELVADQYAQQAAAAPKAAPAPAAPQTPAVDDGTPRDSKGNPLPTYTDESGQRQVDLAQLWNERPEEWCKWNDAHPDPNGVTSREKLSHQISLLDAQISEGLTTRRQALLDNRPQSEISAIDRRLTPLSTQRQRYQDILDTYATPAQQGGEVQMSVSGGKRGGNYQTKAEQRRAERAAAKQSAAASSIGERMARLAAEKADAAITAAATDESARAAAMQEYLDSIASEGMPARVETKAGIADAMRDAGCSETEVWSVAAQTVIADATRCKVEGFRSSGNLFVISDYMDDADEVRSTYVHERQHAITDRDRLVRALSSELGAEVTDMDLRLMVKRLSGVDYGPVSRAKLLDEILSMSMQRAYDYAPEELEMVLRRDGVNNDIIINFVKNLNDVQSNDPSLALARRPAHVGNNAEGALRQDGGDRQRLARGNVGEQGGGARAGGDEGTGDENSAPASEAGGVEFSLSGASADYESALDEGRFGDLDALVRRAAAAAMPDTKVVGPDGLPAAVYHQTNAKQYINKEDGRDWESLGWEEREQWSTRDDWDEHWEARDFTVFDRRNARTSIEMPAFFFAPEDDPYHEYGDRTVKAYLNITNPALNPVIPDAGVHDDSGMKAMQDLIARGYDGFVRTDEQGRIIEWGAFFPNQIKSAEPVTYDNAGDIVPLSERFNPENDDIRFSIIGVQGAQRIADEGNNTRLLQNLAVAEQMEKAGKASDTIYLATGWERGADGKWRTEVPDFELKQNALALIGVGRMTLGDIVEDTPGWKALRDAYPSIADIPVFSAKDLPKGSVAGYYVDLDKIGFNAETMWTNFHNLAEVRSTLLHEVQHAIQKREGFEPGANGNSPDLLKYGDLARLQTEADIAKEEYKIAALRNPVLRFTVAAIAGRRVPDALISAAKAQMDQLFPGQWADWERLYMTPAWERDNLPARLKPNMMYTSGRLIEKTLQLTDTSLSEAKEKKDAAGRALMAERFRIYSSVAGEVEARNVSRRSKMDMMGHLTVPISETEDVERENQIVRGAGEPYSQYIVMGEAVEDSLLGLPDILQESEVTPAFPSRGVEEMVDDALSFSLREGPAPKNSIPVYKLMRLGDDGNVYPLFIDRDAAPLEMGRWYDADSPSVKDLEDLDPGYAYLIDPEGNVVDRKKVNRTEKGSITRLPNVAAVTDASRKGLRWMTVTLDASGARSYHNVGINGAAKPSTSVFALRPGWHAGSLPTMRQIGKGRKRNIRDDRFVWVEGRMAADVDYQGEADANPGKDIPSHIPVDGYYMKATNADKAASQADRVGWYVSGAFMPERIIGDREAESVIDDWNAKHPDATVLPDFPRRGGRIFDAETMSLQDRKASGISVSDLIDAEIQEQSRALDRVNLFMEDLGLDFSREAEYHKARIDALTRERENEELLQTEDIEDGYQETGNLLDDLMADIRREADGIPSVEDGSILFSLSRRNRETVGRWLDKRADLTHEQKQEAIDYLEKMDDARRQLATAFWYSKGVIRIPEDMYKVDDALDVAAKAKVDPLSYESPMALLEANKQFTPSGRPIDPDTVSTLHRAEEYPEAGIVIYDVDESQESRENMRQIINTHFGKDANPWCLLQGEDGVLTDYSANMWYDEYNAYPKQVAFQNGKLLAFSANNTDDVVWWDRQDRQSRGLETTRTDDKGRTVVEEFIPGEGYSEPKQIFQGSHENGMYREWFPETDTLMQEGEWKDGKRIGEHRTYYRSGALKDVCSYVDGKQTGEGYEYHENGSVKWHYTFDDLGLWSHFEEFTENGQILTDITRVEGRPVGDSKEWYANGQMARITHFEDGRKEGLETKWWENGNLKSEMEFKGGEKHGRCVHYFEDGKIEQEDHWYNGMSEGRMTRWFEDGKVASVADYHIGERNGLSVQFDRDGNVETIRSFRRGLLDGPNKEFYKGMPVSYELISDNLHQGIYVAYDYVYSEGSQTSERRIVGLRIYRNGILSRNLLVEGITSLEEAQRIAAEMGLPSEVDFSTDEAERLRAEAEGRQQEIERKPLSPEQQQALLERANERQKTPDFLLDEVTEVGYWPDEPDFSLSRRNRETVEAWIGKRSDLTEDERRAAIQFIDSLDGAPLQLATARWYSRGTIRLPEDMEKVNQAVEVAAKAKVDPLSYNSPMALLEANMEFSVSEKPIDPDTVSTLHRAQEFPETGLVIYDVDESQESRENMRQIINTHFGKDASPWCLLQGDGKGNLTAESERYWNHYDAYPKQVAFQNGKLLAFSANSNSNHLWWDRTDAPHHGVPVTRKMEGDNLGRTELREFDPRSGEMGEVLSIYKGDPRVGHYEEWWPSTGNLRTSRTKVRSEGGFLFVGPAAIYYEDGMPQRICNFDEKGRAVGEDTWYYRNGMPASRETRDGTGHLHKSERFHELNGAKQKLTLYDEEGRPTGTVMEWFANGRKRHVTHYEDGKLNGIEERWDGRGRLLEHFEWKDGLQDGIQQTYYPDGKLQDQQQMRRGEKHGKGYHWYENGQLYSEGEFIDDAPYGWHRVWNEDGSLYMESHYRGGKKNGVSRSNTRFSTSEYRYKDGLRHGLQKSRRQFGDHGIYELDLYKDGEFVRNFHREGISEEEAERITREEYGIEPPTELSEAAISDLRKLADANISFSLSGKSDAARDLADDGIASNNDEVRFSVRYAPRPGEVKKIVDDITKETGISRKRAERWVKSETSIAAIILDEMYREQLDYTADDRYKAIKKDSDYPQGTVDFNNICRKRVLFTKVYERIQREFPNTVISGADLATIRSIMQRHGMTVACGLCYVEDRRQLLGEIATEFIEEMKGNFENYATGSKTKERNAGMFRRLLGDDRKEDLSIYDLISLSGAIKLSKEHPGIYNAFQAYNAARGQQAGNLFQGYAEYKREILRWTKSKVRSVNRHGGLRVFSYSDFEAHHLIDLVQIIQDCARKGVMIQGYTKVPAFARAVVNTNIKLNRSLIPLGDTGMKDGALAYDPVEGIDINDEDFLESNDNIGNIVIGINDEQIRLAMADPFIHFIIPYHSNQSSALRKMKNTGAWKNYKNEQTEKGGKEINIYTDVLAAAEDEGNPIRTERQFTEKFLSVCKERGLKPRFWRFLNTNENGDYIYTPGYYKMLVDFKLFDEKGKILPQKPVVAEFDDEFNAKILKDYAAEAAGKDDDATIDIVYDEIVETLGLSGRNADVSFSLSNQSNAIFISNAEKAAEGIRQEKATSAQWKAMLQKEGGLKPGEDKWIGLSDWLSEQKGTITKQQVLDYIREHRIQIEEVHYEDLDNSQALRDLQEEFDTIPFDDPEAMWQEADDRYAEFVMEMEDKYGEDWGTEMTVQEAQLEDHLLTERDKWVDNDKTDYDRAFDAMVEKYGDDFAIAFTQEGGVLQINDPDAAGYFLDSHPINDTRSGYQTRGLENNHEIALTVPTVEPYRGSLPEVHFADEFTEGKTVAWARFGDAKMPAEQGAVAAAKEKLSKAAESFNKLVRELKSKYGVNTYGDLLGVVTEEERAELGRLGDESGNTLNELDAIESKGGGKVLFIDEIQSQRHQDAREKGGYRDKDLYSVWQRANEEFLIFKEKLAKKYAVPFGFDVFDFAFAIRENGALENDLKEYQRLYNVQREAREAYKEGSDIPAAPFEKNWHELAFKRMLRYAAENGYDFVAWTTGAQQAERYDLGRAVARISSSEWSENEDGVRTRDIDIIPSNRPTALRLEVDESGKVVSVPEGRDPEMFIGKNLGEIVGKDRAAKLMADEAMTLEGNGLRIGAEGMNTFYDEILPNFVNKYGKKWGVKVEDRLIPNVGPELAGVTAHTIPVTEEMKESVMEGQVMFAMTGHISDMDPRERMEIFQRTKSFSTALFDYIDNKSKPEGERKYVRNWQKIGRPSSLLLRFTNLSERAPININLQNLDNHARYHGFDLASMRNLPMEVQDPLAIFSNPEYGDHNYIILTRIKGDDGRNIAVVVETKRRGENWDDTYVKSVHFREPSRIILDTVDNNRGLYFADDFAEFAEEIEKRASAYPTTQRDSSRKNPLTAAKVANHWRKTNFPEEKKPDFSLKGSITPEQDAEYMAAVEAGDTKKTQEMVNEAARAAGYTVRGYHGTTQNFTVFDRSKGNAEGNWGKGFYFTNNLDDAEVNYASEAGADLTVKIDRLAENMEWMDGYEDMTYEERLKEAEKILVGDNPHVVNAALRMENPVIFNPRPYAGDKETYFDLDSGYDPETDEYADEPSGLLVDFIDAWNEELGEWRWDSNNFSTFDGRQFYEDGEGYSASQLEKKAREILDNNGFMDENGELASGEFLRAVLERMGFDGIVDEGVNLKFGTGRRYGKSMDGVMSDTIHLIAFRPEQIKQVDPVTYDDNGNVIPLSERFNPESDDIRFSLRGITDDFDKDGVSIDNNDVLDEYGLSSLTLTKNGDVVILNKIVAKNKGVGSGTRFMEDLVRLADANGWTLALTPDDSFGASSVSRLKTFYKRFGFKPNKGRGADLSISESMVRRPEGDIHFSLKGSITPEQDAEYMAAVEADDMEKAQEMVNEAARMAMPESMVVDEFYVPKAVLHGTKEQFNEFDPAKIGSGTDAGWLGRGFYFYGNNPEYASQYANFGNPKGGRIIKAFLNIENPYWASVEDFQRLADANSREASEEFTRELKEDGYDGVYYNGDGNEEWVAFYPNQIKSADPVTYDDNGNVIPLSERFNPGSNDIRFSLSAAPVTAEDVEDRGIEAVIGSGDRSAFYQRLYFAVPAEIRREIVGGEDFSVGPYDLMKDWIGRAAYDGYWKDETGVLRFAADALRAQSENPESISDDLARYILWNEANPYDPEDIESVARHTAMKRYLGLAETQRRVIGTDSPAFRRWFDGSQVVNPDGSPKVVYHGTAVSRGGRFFVFDTEDAPAWFSDTEEYARNYQNTVRGEKPRKAMYATYLSIKNPLRVGDTGWGGSDLLGGMARQTGFSEEDLRDAFGGDPAKQFGYMWEAVSTKEFKQLAESKGYDGIFATEYGVQTYGVFRPEQVKSATDNNGDFDPSTPDIRFSLSRSEYDAEIGRARAETETNPTDAQKAAGNYSHGHITVDGFDISLENPKGSVRSGKDKSGKPWSITMNNDYGYIRMTEGTDGDHIDVFLSDYPLEGDVYVIDQVDEKGAFDEHKVMYGFPSEEAAREAYLSNYSSGWKGLGGITGVTKDEFRRWVESSHRKTKPFAEYKSVQFALRGHGRDERLPLGYREEAGIVSPEAVRESIERNSKAVVERVTKAKDYFDSKRKALGGSLRGAIALIAQKGYYDKETVKAVTDAARAFLREQDVNDLSRREVARILSLVSQSAGSTPYMIRKNTSALLSAMVEPILRSEKSRLDALLARRTEKVSKDGIQVMDRLDIHGQRILRALHEGIERMSLGELGGDTRYPSIEEAIADAVERSTSEDNAVAEEAKERLIGLNMAKMYHEGIAASEADEFTLDNERNAADEAYRDHKYTQKEYREIVAELEAKRAEIHLDRIETYRLISGLVEDFIAGSQDAALLFREEQEERMRQIYLDAARDMRGRSAAAEREDSWWRDRVVNGPITRFLFSMLPTFDQMLRHFGRASVDGDGWLHRRFMNLWNSSADAEIVGREREHKVLDAKVSEVFGKKMRWSDLYAIDRRMPKATISWMTADGVKKEFELTQGNLLYIYMVNKMTDGRMKLREMGITDEDVKKIKDQMDPRFIALADWLQDDYLVKARNRYNDLHIRLFGAPMAAVENYFPLRINQNARFQEQDTSAAPGADGKLPTDATGAIVKRRVNRLPLDLMNANAFSVAIEHVDEMEKWYAFAEFNRDIRTLLSNTRFRNQVENMSTIYGAGKQLWKTFVHCCQLAAGTYQSESTEIDKAAMNIAKGQTAAAISLRVYTAMKQVLSHPAFVADTNPLYLAKATATPWAAWSWGMENLPQLKERFASRFAGDTRLLKSDKDWWLFRTRIYDELSKIGMSPNAFIDALTCSIGAKAVYDTRRAQYLKDGYTKEQAEEKARKAASSAFNSTQQSSQGAFVSPVQMDRTLMSAIVTTFRNSSAGYQRQLVDALRNEAKFLTRGYRARSVEQMKQMMMADGLTEEQAEHAANRRFNREVLHTKVRIATFGFLVQFAWNLGSHLFYLLFGDDDDKKKGMIEEDAIHALLGGSIEGLGGGQYISELANMIATGQELSNYDPFNLPFTSELKKVIHEFSSDEMIAMNDLVGIVVTTALGVNPRTVTDMVIGVVDAAEGNLDVAKEALLLAGTLMSVPKSQMDQLMLDELDMPAGEARKLKYEEIATRYAHKRLEQNSALSSWAYSDEVERKREDAYLKKFKTMATARFGKEETDEMAADVTKAVNRRERLRKAAATGDPYETARVIYNDVKARMKDAKGDDRRAIKESDDYKYFKVIDRHEKRRSKLARDQKAAVKAGKTELAARLQEQLDALMETIRKELNELK